MNFLNALTLTGHVPTLLTGALERHETQFKRQVGGIKTGANFAFDDINIVQLKMKGLNGRKYQHSQGGVIDFAPFFCRSTNGVQIFYGIHDSGRAIRNAADSAQFG